MLFDFGFYSSILLIFFSQGIVFACLLLRKGIISSSRPTLWLSVFIFLCSLYILPWMLGFAGWYAHMPYRDIMFYVPFQQLLLIGPSLYFYTQSLLNPRFVFKPKDWLHLVPALAYLCYRIVVVVVDRLILDEYFFYARGRDLSLDTWYQLAGFSSMTIYLLLSLRYYAIYKRVIYYTLSFADNLLFSWIKKCLVAFLVMQMLWLAFYLMYPGWGNFTAKWWYFIAFSSIMYYIGFSGYLNNERSLIPFRISALKKQTVYLLNVNPNALELPETEVEMSYSEVPAPVFNPAMEEWKTKIALLVESEHLYRNPGLTLQDLAERLSTNQTLVSKMINQGFGVSFNDYINNYRIREVIDLLEQGEHKRQTLLGISIDCGFNSKTTFNRCFKKHTSLTPKEYIAKLGKKDN